MRARIFTVLIVLVALGASACGSSSKSAADNSTSTTAAPSGGSTGASGATGASGTATTTTEKLSGNSGSSFCDLARSDENVFKSSNSLGSTPADLKKLYGNIGPALAEAESKAPSAIKADFHTFVTAFGKVAKALSDANYDVTKLSPATFAALGTPAVSAASDHIQQYLTQVCHVVTSSTS